MNLGKKILSAFVEVAEEQKPVDNQEEPPPVTARPVRYQNNADTSKFRQYFDKLFAEANIAGPDYYEFSKMIDAMQAIPDEKARYVAAFAGLSMQGLDKEKLLTTATEYLQILDTDAANFHQTVNVAVQEKVRSKQQEMEEKNRRIQQLSQEITDLHNKIAVLQNEVKENEEKLQSNNNSYETESVIMKNKIATDIEKIKQHIN